MRILACVLVLWSVAATQAADHFMLVLPAESGDASAVPPLGDPAQPAPTTPPPAGPAPDAIARPVCNSTAIRRSNPNHPYICRVQGWLGGGAFAWGSGTLVYEADGCGYVLTAEHVIDGVADVPRRIKVHFPDGSHWWAAVHARHPGEDMVMLRIAATGISPAVVRQAEPRPGEILYSAGYGGTGEIRFTRGVANHEYHTTGGATQCAILGGHPRQGDSGGPILDAQGLFCGVQWGGGSGMSMGSRWTPVRAILGRVGVTNQVSLDVPGRDARAAGVRFQPSPLFNYQPVQSCPGGNCGATQRFFFRR